MNVCEISTIPVNGCRRWYQWHTPLPKSPFWNGIVLPKLTRSTCTTSNYIDSESHSRTRNYAVDHR